ncbi:ribosome silencing factor [Frigoribacterium sp. Leaf186]|uniref:ribosome silencing factor n=1 Tax=Frigoribacterium sp. Leaf186 TaxID=1736293 RepID=UPI0006F81AFD|nr:ribosome silencing factor [Frigoribacterium sp. Leaf186]KQS15779.1 ribosomal silencing factor RsfS [Frigoribacterium sp. Leaf186]
MTATPRAIELLQIAARAADDKQADDLVALDVSGPLPLTDVFLLATGRSERNVVAIAGEIEDKMLEAGVKTLRREGRAEGRWVLLDFGDVVAHVFHDEDRQYYALERLWSDCPTIPLDVLTESAAASTDAAVDAPAEA